MNNTQFPKAVFRAPGAEQVDEFRVTSRVVADGEQLEAALAEGWHLSAPDAHAAHQAERDAEEDAEAERRAAAADKLPATREELEQKATELGIKFKPQTSNKQLGAEIAAKLADQAQ